MTHKNILYILALICCMSCAKQEPGDQSTGEQPENNAHLGKIAFTPSCSDEAAKAFEEGLLLLHSFEYEDAAIHFQEAQQADSTCVMAYWGEAMTHHHTLWSAQYTEKGQAVLAKLGPDAERRLAMAQTDLERDFLEGAEILFADGDKLQKDSAYAVHMAEMYSRYKGNHEVAAFYALSLLGSTPERDVENYEKGAIIAQGIIDENPEHPGALHYLIHSYDDPDHAHFALNAADKYSKVAPDAGHALHMPSHIYVALGMWDEVISSNIASWNADKERKENLELDEDGLNHHALQWLMYGLLQKGRVDTARTLVHDMLGYARATDSKGARAYASMMRGGFLAETANWTDSLAGVEIKDSDLNIVMRSMNDFVAGMHAYTTEDISALALVIDSMEAARNEAYTNMMQRGSTLCSGVGWSSQLPTQSDINYAHIMEMELRAMRAALEGDTDATEDWLVRATDLEDETSFMFGPPTVIKPSHELFGEWLYEQGRYEEARSQFEAALKKAPKRRLSVKSINALNNNPKTL